MSKQVLLAISLLVGLILLTLLAVGYRQIARSAKNSVDNKAVQPKTQAVNQASIKSLLNSGQDQVCTIKYGQGSGTIYAAGDKARGDIALAVGGRNLDTHIIKEAEYLYTWTSSSDQGIKFNIKDVDQAKILEKNGLDLDKKGEVNCKPWVTDTAKFNLPPEIKFTDITQLLKELGQF